MGGMSTRNEIKARLGILAEPPAKARFAETTIYTVAAHVGNDPAGERTARSLDEAKAYAKIMLEAMKSQAKGKPVVVDVYPVVNYEPKPSVLTLRASRPSAKAKMGKWDGVEVIADFTWRNKQTGATASSGGSAPYVRQSDAANWEKVPHFAFYDSRTNQTIGQQYKTRQQAEAALRDRKAQEERDRAKQDRLRTTPAARRSEAIWKEIDRLMSRGMTQMEAIDYLKSRGLRMASSRPGAKAKMDKNADYVEYANLRETLSKLENRLRRAPVEQRARLQRELDAGIKRYRELADRLRSSRPGAKAKMDLTDVQRKAGYKWRVAYTRQLGKDQYLGGPPVTMQDDLLFATESAARQWADTMLKKGWFKGQGGGPEKILKATVLMASRPGAKSTHAAADKPGRKVMAESDPAVSAKIRKLMAEGKPQKQAVAIALDMKRRGEI